VRPTVAASAAPELFAWKLPMLARSFFQGVAANAVLRSNLSPFVII